MAQIDSTLCAQVAFFMIREVQDGEELTWDYGCDFSIDDGVVEPFACMCGSTVCRGQ